MPVNLNQNFSSSWRRDAFGASAQGGLRLAANPRGGSSFNNALSNNLQILSGSGAAPGGTAHQLPAGFQNLKPPVRGLSQAAASTGGPSQPSLKPPASIAYHNAISGQSQQSGQRAALGQINHTVNRAAARPAPLASNLLNTHKNQPAGSGQRALSRSPLRQEYEKMAHQAADRHGVDPNLVKAVISAESDYNPGVVSKAGAMGLMQLMPGTAKDMQVQNPFDPAQNIEGGTKYLAWLSKMFDGDEQKILAAYNWGPGNVRRGGNLPKETSSYLAKVSQYRNAYEALAQNTPEPNRQLDASQVLAKNDTPASNNRKAS